MNTRSLLSLAFVASLFLTSCKKELKPQDSSDTPLTETIAAPENATPIVPQEEAVATQVQAPAAVQNVQPATVQPTAPGMNPPHGEPGHRCDIAVGAPLNSPKQTPAAPVAPSKPAATVQQVTPPQPVTETAPGMNPPHGQPGHRCEIAVGAPLPTE